VGESAGHDEQSEKQKHPVKRYFAAAAVNEMGEGDRYGEIGDANQSILELRRLISSINMRN